MGMKRAERSVETGNPKDEAEGVPGTGKEGNSDSENEEQINCGVRAWEETGMLGRKEYPVSLMRENNHRLGKQYNVWERVRALRRLSKG